MRKNALFMVLVALLFGAAGAFFRTNELMYAFDSKGLSVRGAPETLLLILLTAVVFIVFLAWTLLLPREKMNGTKAEAAFELPGIASLLMAIIASLTIIVAAGAYFLRQWLTGQFGALVIAFAVLAALAGLALIVISIGAFRGKLGSAAAILSVIPALFFCGWLVLSYRINARNPDIIVFVYECVALGLAALAFYYRAGAYFGRVRSKAAIFFHALAIYFGIVTLADYREFAESIIIAAAVVVLTIDLYCILRNQRPAQKEQIAENSDSEA